MKILKPQELNFASNISEPDPSQGESVWQEPESVSYNMDIEASSLISWNGFFYGTDTRDNPNSLLFKYRTFNADYSQAQTSTSKRAFHSVDNSAPTGVRQMAEYNGVILATNYNLEDLIFRSADGGLTWTSIVVGFHNFNAIQNPNGVIFTDSGVAYCFGRERIMRSTDGGLTWVSIGEATIGSFPADSSLCYDGNFISLVGYDAIARITTDGTQISTFSNTFGTTYRGAAASDGVLHVFCADRNVYVSFNGGPSLSSLGSYSSNGVNSVTSIGGTSYFIPAGGVSVESVTRSGDFNTHLSGNFYRVFSAGAYVFVSELGGSLGVLSGASYSEVAYYPYAGNYQRVCSMCSVDGNGFVGLSQEGEFSCFADTGSAVLCSSRTAGGFYIASRLNLGGTEFIRLRNDSYSEMFEVKSSEFTGFQLGQCLLSGNHLYALIKDGGSWFVYKVNMVSEDVSSLDLGAENSGYIDNVNDTTPVMFGDSLGISIPINKSLSDGRFDNVLRLDFTPSVLLEVTPNELFSENVQAAVSISDDSVTWILSESAVRVTDATNYDSLSGYFEGDEVVSQTTHRRYRATTNTLDTPEIGSQKTPPTWTDIAPTNKYAAFSTYLHHKTIAADLPTNTIIFNFSLDGSQDSISLFGLEDCVAMTVIARDGGGNVIYNEDIFLVDTVASEKLGETVLLDQFSIANEFTDADTLSVEIFGEPNGSELAKVGRIVVGRAVELGVTQYGASLSVEDFSRRERDEFGNFTVIPRDTAKNINFDVKINKSDVNFVFNYLSSLTTTPCVWLGDDEDSALQVYGFYSDYTHNIDYPSITSATISVEGLT